MSCNALDDLDEIDVDSSALNAAHDAQMARFAAASRLIDLDIQDGLRRVGSMDSMRSSTESIRHSPVVYRPASPPSATFTKTNEERAEKMLAAPRSPPVSKEEEAKRASNEAYKAAIGGTRKAGSGGKRHKQRIQHEERAEALLSDRRGKSGTPGAGRAGRPPPAAAGGFSPGWELRAEQLLRGV